MPLGRLLFNTKITLISWSFCLKNMLTESLPISTQQNLFHSELFNQLDTKDPLIALSHTMDWEVFDVVFSRHYCHDNGVPSKPIRLMVGLLILKQLENLSDERVVL
jgi:IS5 family transposase